MMTIDDDDEDEDEDDEDDDDDVQKPPFWLTLPGVIFSAFARFVLSTLYSTITYLARKITNY